jgi:hypothetical protein
MKHWVLAALVPTFAKLELDGVTKEAIKSLPFEYSAAE